MESMLDVSVVVVNYNTFDLTCNCIRSIVTFTKDTTYEIILVDNASIDRPTEALADLFPKLTIIKSQENVGFAKGNNLGIAHAKGKYILLLNSDTVLINDAITLIKNFLDLNPEVATASARLEDVDGTAQHNCQRFPSIRYKLFELLRLQKLLGKSVGAKVLLGPFFDYNSITYPDWVWGTFFMFRKEHLELLPGKKLADDFFMYGEDMQWCMEFRKLGFKVAFVPQARVIHLLGKSGGKKNEWLAANQKRFMDKYYSGHHRIALNWLDRLF